MAKQKPPNQQSHAVSQVAAAAKQAHSVQQQIVTTELQQYSGQIPPPDLLRGFDDLLPGTAARLIQWAEDEQQHRRHLEREAQASNIAAQQRQLTIAEYQSRSVFRSDLVGQVLGFAVCAACVAGAVWLAVQGQPGVAIALTVIPTGAVVMAFRNNLFSKKPPASGT